MTQEDSILDIVNKEIERLHFDASPQSLFEPISYILSLGGKRIRPVLTLLSCELLGGKYKDAIPMALAIEVFHNFTLLHDDLMDKSAIRRGKATVHKKWNDNTAVLSGDAMLIESYHLISKNKKKHLKELLHLFSKTATEICCGQQLDMEFESREDVTEEEYIEMIRLKTAVLLGCSLKSGAIIANASEKDANLLSDFGINLGLAFQLKDDLLDVYGDSKKFGKNIGGDIASNKKTFLLINALKAESTREELQSWIRKETFVRKEKIKAVTAIYNQLGLKELSESRIEEYYEKAISCLEQVNVSEKKKKELYEIASGLSYRKS
jgi:geranylgeranyl diphosphate synthase, type II